MKKLSVIILAAGEGTRMKSDTPKVLHKVCGTPMLTKVLDTVKMIKPEKICVIVGHKADQVKKAYEGSGIIFALQAKQLGSGHALMQAKNIFSSYTGNILVLCGDAPLIRPETLKEFLAFHAKQENDVTVLSADIDNPFGYGRIVKQPSGQFSEIVEEKDAQPVQKRIKEINSGIYCFKSRALWNALKKIKNNNNKGEYYLTDTISILNSSGASVGAYKISNFTETLGINSRADLAKAESILKRRTLDKLMADGVTIIDPNNTYISCEARIGKDTIIYPGTIINGTTEIGMNSNIGPNSFIQNSKLGNDCEVRTSYIYDSLLSDSVKIGPFAHLRPGTVIKENARVGNFSEIKKSTIGCGSKVSHLSYIGDTVLGVKVNVGAGTITCNYDGVNKHKTHIGDGTFVGSNVNLVAPLNIGKNVLIAAGSTITEDIPEDSLAIARSRQILKQRKK